MCARNRLKAAENKLPGVGCQSLAIDEDEPPRTGAVRKVLGKCGQAVLARIVPIEQPVGGAEPEQMLAMTQNVVGVPDVARLARHLRLRRESNRGAQTQDLRQRR